MKPTQFEHTPLTLHTQEMRIVKILPSLSKDGYICCEMEHVRLDDTNSFSFDALSYMWGPKAPRKRILVNGSAFMVRENLWDFLNAARQTRPREWLWIDALSIAQTNGEEKVHQIRLMRDSMSALRLPPDHCAYSVFNVDGR